MECLEGQTEGLILEHFLWTHMSQVSHWLASLPFLQDLEHMPQGNDIERGLGLDSTSPESRSKATSQPPGG